MTCIGVHTKSMIVYQCWIIIILLLCYNYYSMMVLLCMHLHPCLSSRIIFWNNNIIMNGINLDPQK